MPVQQLDAALEESAIFFCQFFLGSFAIDRQKLTDAWTKSWFQEKGGRPTSINSKKIRARIYYREVNSTVAVRMDRPNIEAAFMLQLCNHLSDIEKRLETEGNVTSKLMLRRYVRNLLTYRANENPCHRAVALGCWLFQYAPSEVARLMLKIYPFEERFKRVVEIKQKIRESLESRFRYFATVNEGGRDVVVGTTATPPELQVVAETMDVVNEWLPHAMNHPDLCKLPDYDSEDIRYKVKHFLACTRTTCGNLSSVPLLEVCCGGLEKLPSYRLALNAAPKESVIVIPSLLSSSGPGESSRPTHSGVAPPPPPSSSGQAFDCNSIIHRENARRKRYRGPFRILVDSISRAVLDPSDTPQKNSCRFQVDEDAREINIYGVSKNHDLLCAALVLPELDYSSDWKTMQYRLELDSGQYLLVDLATIATAKAVGGKDITIGVYEGSLWQRFIQLLSSTWRHLGLPDAAPVAQATAMVLAFALSSLLGALFISHQKQAQVLSHAEMASPNNFAQSLARTALINGYQDLEKIRTPEGSRSKSIAQFAVIRVSTSRGEYPVPTLRGNADQAAQALANEAARTETTYRDYIAFVDAWTHILRQHATNLLEVGKITDTIRVFEFLVENHQDAPEASRNNRLVGLLFALGELQKLNGDHRAAIALYKRILDENLVRNDPRPYHFKGFSEYVLGDFDAALASYEQALAIDRNYAKVYFNQALVFRARGDEQRAQKNLAEAEKRALGAYVREGDGNPRIAFTLSLVSAARNNLDKSLHWLDLAIRQDRLYIVRARADPALEPLRVATNQPYHAQYLALLKRYDQPSASIGGFYEPYTLARFME